MTNRTNTINRTNTAHTKLLVISDTHGDNSRVPEVLKQTGPVDTVIHCGDVEHGEQELRQMVGCPCLMVSGNCDWDSSLPREILVTLAGKVFYITHGHTCFLHQGYDHLWSLGYLKHADVILFGHTHRPLVGQKGKIWIANPGSLSYPRQKEHRPTYLLIEIGVDGSMDFQEGEL